MEDQLLLNFGSNLATLALALGVFVVYKRCVKSKCAIHSSIIDCESPEIQEIKQRKTMDILKKAMGEFQTETINGNKAFEDSLDRLRNVQEPENHRKGHKV